MKKVLVIAGPTAAGKSDFAVEMAKQLDGIIISGDSIQVYRGFDIGSGKITKAEMQGIPHELIDILGPRDHYSAADFQKMARAIIDTTEKFPMICGGTGLYLKACLYDYAFPAENHEETIDPALDQMDNDALYALLVEKDPVQAEKIHPHNRRRVMRALTILARQGKTMSSLEAAQTHMPVYDIWIAGCTMDRDKLYARINARVEKMFALGLEQEVKDLLQNGSAFSDQAMQGIGYREFEPYIKGECTLDDVKTQIQTHSRQFAKRQYTWLRHQLPVHWFDITDEKEKQKMAEEIINWSNS
jgi:tRNA dimethylallyltransferase